MTAPASSGTGAEKVLVAGWYSQDIKKAACAADVARQYSSRINSSGGYWYIKCIIRVQAVRTSVVQYFPRSFVLVLPACQLIDYIINSMVEIAVVE